MITKTYNNFKEEVMKKVFDLVNDTVKVCLLTSSYTPDIDNHTVYSDVSSYEVSGTGYTAGGETLTNKTVTQDNTNDKGKFDADDITWSNATITARYAVLYDVTASNKLIGYEDFETDKSSSGSDFGLTWTSNGILRLG